MLMTYGLISLVVNKYNYDTQGRDTPAVVTDCNMRSWGRSGDVPEISYEYSVAGVTYTNKHTVARCTIDCSDFQAGTHLTARYLIRDITQSTIVDESANREWWDALIMYGGVGCVTLFAIALTLVAVNDMYFNWVAKFRHPRLLKNGVLLDGAIMKATSSLEARSKRYHVHIRYQFTTPDGRALERTQSRERPDLRNQPLPEVGTPVKILYADDAAVMML